ncbi:hypothetical protein LRP88_04336 [Fusarium phalaenopsidis]
MVTSRTESDPQTLLEQLTTREKISLLAGQSFFETTSIPRLGIPSAKFTDGPNGARGATMTDGPKAACFPASVSLAATWDRDLVYRVASALADDAKMKSAVGVLGPTICPHRSPLGGRNFESFSEDPYLAGTLASRYVDGLQTNGVAAVVKHFAANEQETMRRMINVIISEKALREIYLKPFEIVAKAAKPWAFMTSYNLVNGHHADMSEYLLRHVLRDQWGYKGLVVSDWGGTNSTVESIHAGVDLEMPGPTAKRKYEDVRAAIDNGELPIEDIDSSALRVLEFVKKTGKFENPDTPPERAILDPRHSDLIREAGAEGIVLLRNEDSLLPLNPDRMTSVALLGLAKECLAFGGGSAKVNCHYKVTPYEAIERLLSDQGVDIRYAKGAQTFRNLQPMKDDLFDLDGKPGMTLSRYRNRDLAGEPAEKRNVTAAIYLPNLQHSESRQVQASVTLDGTYRPSTTGRHYLSFSAMGESKLFVDDKLVLDCGNSFDPVACILGADKEETCQYDFIQGQSYRIRVESLARLTDPHRLTPNSFFDGLLTTRVGFMPQPVYEEDILPEAVEAASSSEVAIVFVGNTTEWETEGQDLSSMSLPARGSQDRLISAVAKVNPNVVVVNCTGVPIEMPWLSSVSAVIQAWYPGMEAGNSIADVLFGMVNPGGKLPVTMPRSFADTPCYGNFPGDLEKLEVRYEEGVFVGYRYYDQHPDRALFPFGFGLSYTKFGLSLKNPRRQILQDGRKSVIQVEFKNIGKVTGSLQSLWEVSLKSDWNRIKWS